MLQYILVKSIHKMFSSKKEEEWEKWLQCYTKVMKLYAAKKKKEKLIKIDEW